MTSFSVLSVANGGGGGVNWRLRDEINSRSLYLIAKQKVLFLP